MKVLVTGASGAAGSYFCEWLRLNRPEVEVRGTRRYLKKNEVPGVEYVQWSHEDPGAAEEAVQRADVVVNFASWANVRASFEEPRTYLENNILATVDLLEAVRLHAPTARFLHVSTSEVYGAVALGEFQTGIPETAPLRPVSPYAASKAAQDLIVESYRRSYGMHAVRTRAFGYINGRRPDLVATSFAYQIAKIERSGGTLHHGNLNSVRTFLSVEDLCNAYWVCATQGVSGEVYNVGSTHPVTIDEVLSTLVRISGKGIGTAQDPALLRPADVTLQIPNTDKVRALGWRDRTSDLEPMLKNLLEEMRAKVAKGVQKGISPV